MNVNVQYGESDIAIEVPSNTQKIEPKDIESKDNEQEAVINSLRNPIDTKPLKELVNMNDKVAIVISDITRPTPNHILVPALIEELSHVPKENFVIINGTGTHRDQTNEEFEKMLGKWVVENIKIVNNHCQDKNTLSYVGESKFGCEVFLNKDYVEADFRITTGFIEPHFFAGFSGGPKGNMPGIAGIDTIMTFHNAKMIGDPKATWGNMLNNPVQDMTREVNSMCPPDFMLNVTLNQEKEITEVFAGELFAAHDRGCEYVKKHAMIPCDNRFDVVITSNSGYPLDQNLYQSVKGMSAAQKIVKKGGTIIVVAECRDGVPNHGNFAEIFKLADTPQELLEIINDPSFKMFDQWQVQKQAVVQEWANVLVHSTLDDETIESLMLTPCTDIENELGNLALKYGQEMSVAVLPQGPLTIPYIKEEGS